MGKMYLKKTLKLLHKTNISDNLMAPAPIIISGAIINSNQEWSTKFNQVRELFLRGNFIGF